MNSFMILKQFLQFAINFFFQIQNISDTRVDTYYTDSDGDGGGSDDFGFFDSNYDSDGGGGGGSDNYGDGYTSYDESGGGGGGGGYSDDGDGFLGFQDDGEDSDNADGGGGEGGDDNDDGDFDYWLKKCQNFFTIVHIDPCEEKIELFCDYTRWVIRINAGVVCFFVSVLFSFGAEFF